MPNIEHTARYFAEVFSDIIVYNPHFREEGQMTKKNNDIKGLSESLENIISYIDEGFHMVDKEGITVYYNEKAAELDGLAVEEVIDRNVLEVFPSLTRETSTLLTAIKTGKPILSKLQTFTNFKGHKITTLNSTIPVKVDGEIVGSLEVSKDITKVKELSETILDLQSRLYTKETKKTMEAHSPPFTVDDIIGEHPSIRNLRKTILQTAKTSSSVLVHGSTGTGKELVVQAVHNASNRKDKPFIAQNCAALPANLLESILFGTVKGSFTDAEDRPGLFQLSDGGTILLDEIHSMPPQLQAKLLRVLEEGIVTRIGDTTSVKVDIRVMAALNIDPWEAGERNYLRQDLFYRLNVVDIRVPDISERMSDIPILANHFVEKYNKKLNMNVNKIAPETMDIFMKFSWPGNVRELENSIERAMNIIDGDTILPCHIPIHIKNAVKEQSELSYVPLRDILEDKEKEIIEKVLLHSNGNISEAARVLDLPRQTLQYKLRKLNIQTAEK